MQRGEELLEVVAELGAGGYVQEEIDRVVGVVDEHDERVGEGVVDLALLVGEVEIERGGRLQQHEPQAHRHEHHRQRRLLLRLLLLEQILLGRGGGRRRLLLLWVVQRGRHGGGRRPAGGLLLGGVRARPTRHHDLAQYEQIEEEEDKARYDDEQVEVELDPVLGAEDVVVGVRVLVHRAVGVPLARSALERQHVVVDEEVHVHERDERHNGREDPHDVRDVLLLAGHLGELLLLAEERALEHDLKTVDGDRHQYEARYLHDRVGEEDVELAGERRCVAEVDVERLLEEQAQQAGVEHEEVEGGEQTQVDHGRVERLLLHQYHYAQDVADAADEQQYGRYGHLEQRRQVHVEGATRRLLALLCGVDNGRG